MNETSLKAYAELKAQRKIQPMEARVLAMLSRAPQTREDIAYRTEMRMSSVCGRVNSLIKAGLVEEFDTVRSLITDKKVKLLRLTFKPEDSCPQ